MATKITQEDKQRILDSVVNVNEKVSHVTMNF